MTTEKEQIINAVTKDEQQRVISAIDILEKSLRETLISKERNILNEREGCNLMYKDLHLTLILETTEHMEIRIKKGVMK